MINKPPQNKRIFLIIIVFVMIGIGIFYYLTIGKFKLCGIDDATCFVEAAKICTPAKITLTEPFMLLVAHRYVEMRGFENNYCIIYNKIEDLKLPSFISPENMSAEVKEEFNKLKSIVIGTDMLCKIPKEETDKLKSIEVIKPWHMKFLDQLEYCEGKLKKLYQNFTGIIQEPLPL